MKRVPTWQLGLMLLATSLASASTWDIELPVESVPRLLDFQIAVNPATGALGLVYQYQEGRKWYLSFKERSVTGVWSAAERITSAKDSFEGYDLVYDPFALEPAVVYMPWRTGSLTFARRGNGDWSGELVDPDAYRYGRAVALAIDEHGTPWVAYLTGGANSPTALTVTHRGESGWAFPSEVVHPWPVWLGDLLVGPDGVAILFGTDTDGDGWDDRVQFGVRQPGGSWSLEEVAGSSSDPLRAGGLAFDRDGSPLAAFQGGPGDYRLAVRGAGSWFTEEVPLPGGDQGCEPCGFWGDPLPTSSGEVLLGVGLATGVQVAHRDPESGDWWYEDVLEGTYPHYPNLATALDPLTELPFIAIQRVLFPFEWENSISVAIPTACTSDAQCDDGNTCTTDACVSGSCIHDQLNGDECGDGAWCVEGSCFEPECSVVADCEDFNECTTEECIGDACLVTDVTAGTPCTDDGDPCTVDACDGAGSCESIFDPNLPGCEPVCGVVGDSCDSGADCCSGLCHPKKGVCK